MLIETFKSILWRQFGASIDMLGNAIRECPDSVWGNKIGPQEFWYIAYHNLFWLDFYMTPSPEAFIPHTDFGLAELDPAGLYPDRILTKAELLEYFDHCRRKCRDVIETMTDDMPERRYVFFSRDLPLAELYLYTMRHVQHHTGQLNQLLRQEADFAPQWVGKAIDSL